VSENVMVPPVGFPLPGIPLLAPAKGCAVVSPAPACLVSFLDRDVILVNEQSSGLTWSNGTSGHFQAQQLVPVPVVGSLSFNRGWAFIDGVFRGDKFRFVTTHLEVETFRDKQEAQARELVAGPLKTLRPVILVGDLNSAADGSTTDSYRILLRALFADAWWTNFGKITGSTCCQAEKLDNEESMLSSRIDFVLTRLALPTSAHLVNEDKIATSPAPPPLWASDHAGVVATVHLL